MEHYKLFDKYFWSNVGGKAGENPMRNTEAAGGEINFRVFEGLGKHYITVQFEMRPDRGFGAEALRNISRIVTRIHQQIFSRN